MSTMVAVDCKMRGDWPVNPEKCYLLLGEVDTFALAPLSRLDERAVFNSSERSTGEIEVLELAVWKPGSRTADYLRLLRLSGVSREWVVGFVREIHRYPLTLILPRPYNYDVLFIDLLSSSPRLNDGVSG